MQRDDIGKLFRELNIDPNLFREDELNQLKRKTNNNNSNLDQSDDDQSMRDSFTSNQGHGSFGGRNNHQQNQQNQQNYNQNPFSQTLENQLKVQIQQQQGKIKILEQELERQKAMSENEKRTLIMESKRQQEILQNELRQLRARHVHVEGQVPMIKEALGQVRDMLSGLVPENVYLRLRDLPERDLPPSEWILVNVWELVYPFKKESELQKKEIFRLREELKQSVDKQNQILGELDHANRMLYDKDDDYKRHQLNYENARKALEVELTKCHEELEILREKGSSYDELLRKFKLIEQEKFLLEEKIGFYDTEAGKEGKHVLNQVYKTTDDINRKNELLKQDKEYLTKENIELSEKNKRLEERLDRLENDLKEAKDQAQEYLFRLLNHKTETVADYEKKVNTQINELREKHNFELKQSKENLIEIYEKQIRFLKDAKEEVEYKLTQAESISKEKERAYNNILIENRTLQNQVNSDMADLRIKLTIKTEELERVQNILEETTHNLKAARRAHEMLQEQLQILKGEYYKEQSQKVAEHAELKAQHAVLSERLRDYETMEKEIDEAVEGLAGNEDAGDPNNPYLMTINNAPTSTRRRVKQAMNLAQRLQSKQKECERLAKMLGDKKEECDELKSQLAITKDLLSKTNQPYSMLLSQIEDKEKEIMKYNKLYNELKYEKATQHDRYLELEKQFEQARQDVQKLMIRRANITNIQNLLLKMSQSDSSDLKGNINSLIQEITEILQNKSFAPQGGSPSFKGSIQNQNNSQYQQPQRDDNPNQIQWVNKLKKK